METSLFSKDIAYHLPEEKCENLFRQSFLKENFSEMRFLVLEISEHFNGED